MYLIVYVLYLVIYTTAKYCSVMHWECQHGVYLDFFYMILNNNNNVCDLIKIKWEQLISQQLIKKLNCKNDMIIHNSICFYITLTHLNKQFSTF